MIRVASEIDWSAVPRCAHTGCGLGVLPYGRSEPFVVTEAGGVFCRNHGPLHDPAYQERLDAYRAQRNRDVGRALDTLEQLAQQGDDPAAAEE